MGSAKCKKYDLSGNKIDEVEISLGEESKANSQSIKDYIVAIRANARQWSANTKRRNESHHSGAKPHPQKGTGNARQGFLGSPQYKGGGRVGTPKPKFFQHVRINKKERRSAIRHLLIEKLEEGNVILLQDQFEKYFEKPRTKLVASLIDSLGWEGTSIAMLGVPSTGNAVDNFKMSMRNIPRLTYSMLENVNAYSLLANQKVIIMDSAMSEMEGTLRG